MAVDEQPSCGGSTRRGRRCPVGAHAGSVGFADCPAVLAHGACRITHCAHLRSLRSNRMRQVSSRSAPAARRPMRSVPRRPRNRPHRAPPAASHRLWRSTNRTPPMDVAKGCPAVRGRACAAPRSGGRSGRARSALRDLTRRECLSGTNAVSATSCPTGPDDRASQGSRREAATAAVARPRTAGQPFAAQAPATPETIQRSTPHNRQAGP